MKTRKKIVKGKERYFEGIISQHVDILASQWWNIKNGIFETKSQISEINPPLPHISWDPSNRVPLIFQVSGDQVNIIFTVLLFSHFCV